MSKEIAVASRKAADRIYADLDDRRGIKRELQKCDEDIQEEIRNTMAEIIAEEMRSAPEKLDLPEDWYRNHHKDCGTQYRGCHPTLCPKEHYEQTGEWKPELSEQ